MNYFDKLILALDVPTLEKALTWINILGGKIKCFKIGTQLFLRGGPDIIRYIKDHCNAEVFLDLKLYDIPNTVVKSAEAANFIGVDYLTLHAALGTDTIAEAVRIAPEVKILVVTGLTSEPISEKVKNNATIAANAGAAGCVCPSSCLNDVYMRFPNGLRVVPGIRLIGQLAQDQVNVATPFHAVFFGANKIVVGRPILEAEKPERMIEKFLEEVEAAERALAHSVTYG